MPDSWWRKLLNNGEMNEKHEDQHIEQGVPSKKGRFEDSTRQVKVRMLNQYPQTNREDHPIEPIKSLAKKEEDSVKTKEKKFVPTYIPSPIYGFNSKVKEKKASDELSIPAYQRQEGRHEAIPNSAYDSSNERSTYSDEDHTIDNQSKSRKLSTYERETPERTSDVNEEEMGVYFDNHEEPHSKIEKVHHPSPYTSKDTMASSSQTINNQETYDQLHDEEFKDVEFSTPNFDDKVANDDKAMHHSPTPHRQSQRSQSHSKHTGPSTNRLPYNVLMNPPKKLTEVYRGGSKKEVEKVSPERNPTVEIPSLELLRAPQVATSDDRDWCKAKEEILRQTLSNFNVKGQIVEIIQGPTVTRFEIRLQPGVKVNKIISLTEDIKLSLAARQIRIAPVPGKNTVGIEIPNDQRKPVYLKQLLESNDFNESKSPLTAALGRDVSGKAIVTDLAKMPHGLIAGATGSGKSVCIHSLILSLIYKATPEELRLILIDPKVVELAAYQKLPHLAAPVLNQPKEAALALKWAVEEMEKRYQVFAKYGVRDISRFNHDVALGKINQGKMPYIVIIIDELADLMMISPQDVEEAICRIAQKARACGIHLLLATQRPSVDVITGLIKSNIPTRIAFSVSSQADSRTILDSGGADRLLGQGDMLFSENGARALKRVQGCFVSDEEIDRVTDQLANYEAPPYLFDQEQLTKQSFNPDEEEDELFEEASYFVIAQGQASISSLQRRFRIGYNRAARLIDQMERYDIISEANGSKPRQIMMSVDRFEAQIIGQENDQ